MHSTQKPAEAGVHLSRRYKVLFGVASLGTSLIAGVYSAMLPIFYQDYLGLAAGWIATASLIYAIWNAVNDPLFGYVTDSTRSRLGRRIPYMRFTAPFLALTFILLWFTPPEATQRGLFWWMLITMLLFDTCYTVIGLVYSALVPEVTESDSERNDLQISFALFGLLGTLLGFVIPDLFRPKAGQTPDFFPLQMAMIGVGIFGALMILATTFQVKERPEFTRVDKPIPPLEALKYTITSRSFLVLVAANFMTILMSAMVTGSLFYVADYVLKMNTMVLLATLFVPLILGVPATSYVRRRLGVVGAEQFFLIIAGMGLVAVMLVPNELIPVCMALAGFGLAGPQTLTNVLFAQVADEDELRSGVRREGAFFGVNALLTKPAQSIALALMPLMLKMTGFVSRSANLGQIMVDQPESAVMGIKAIAGLIPGIAMLLGALLLAFYPLRRERLANMKRDLLALHERKAEALARQESA